MGTALIAGGLRPATASVISPDTLTTYPGEPAMPQIPETFHVVSHEEATAIWFLGTLALIEGDGGATDGTFGVVEFLHPAGFATPLHVHHNEDEAFYVLEGTIHGVCNDEEWMASRGDFVWLPKDAPHGYMVVGEEPVRSLAFSIPAGFEQFVVEAGEPAQARELPPPGEPDIAKLGAAAEKYGQEILGPLPIAPGATPAT
jgi:mannose-6-phosphate isomerase-like protein (cupin superfamily)